MSSVTEVRVQKEIIDLLTTYHVDVAAIDAGGKRARGRLMGAAKSAGVAVGALANVKTGGAIPKGFADLEATLAPSGRSLYIEVKAPAWYRYDGKLVRANGHASAEQLEFLLEKHKRGAVVLVAWSAQDVIDALGAGLLLENRRALT
jgi:hypothetical protein